MRIKPYTQAGLLQTMRHNAVKGKSNAKMSLDLIAQVELKCSDCDAVLDQAYAAYTGEFNKPDRGLSKADSWAAKRTAGGRAEKPEEMVVKTNAYKAFNRILQKALTAHTEATVASGVAASLADVWPNATEVKA